VTRVIARRLAEGIERYRDTVELTVLPSPPVTGILPTDFDHAEELICEGRGRARWALARRRRPAALSRAA
jgi:hypothetical protein